MLKPARTYEEACRTFRWRIPELYNVAFDVCDRQTMAGADGHRTALINEALDGSVERYTFHMLRLLSNRLANALAARGIGAGDRVALAFPPSVEAAVAVLAVTKMGAVAVPIPLGLGLQPMAWRLADSGAAAVLADGKVAARLVEAGQGRPALKAVLSAGDAPAGTEEFWAVLESASDVFAPAVTNADDAAFLFYPMDCLGKPVGMVHAHRAVPGALPAMEFALGFFPQFGDILWPAGEWMSYEALVWGLLPAWHHGVPVVACAAQFDAEHALGLMARCGVRVALLPPGQLEALALAAKDNAHPAPRALATGPHPLAPSVHEAVRAAFGIAANEIWGTPETGAVAANNAQVMEIRPGSPGRAVPGITVEAVDETGCVVRAGERGMLAVAPGAPGTFLGYRDDEPPGRLRLPSGWLMTGRLGSRDLDGYLWPEIAPLGQGVVMIDGMAVALDEVQAALALHPKVSAAAVVAKAGEIKAFVVPVDMDPGDFELARALQDWVIHQRAIHEVPRRIEFVQSLPMDGDGKLVREDLNRLPIRLGAPSPEERL